MKDFDPNANYVVVAGGRYAGHNLAKNYPVRIVEEPKRPGELTEEQAKQLHGGGKIVLASDIRPTPVEKPEDEVRRLSDLEAMGDDKFLIRAPWLAESEIVTGEDAAKARLAEVIEEGLAAYRAAEAKASETLSPANAGAVGSATIGGGDGFAIVESGSNGYFEVHAPGKEPEKVRGKANAEARLVELRTEAATPPVAEDEAVEDEVVD